jgi:nucleotide-binding universal stress UspA family protein
VPDKIVVGFDGTPAARDAVGRAIRLGAARGRSEIILVCTHDRPPDFSRHPFTGRLLQPRSWPQEWAGRVAHEMEHEAIRVRLAGLKASVVCSYDDPDQLLIQVARRAGADTIVVSDDRRGFWYDHILGSVTRRLLHDSDVPVVIVPRDGGLSDRG